MALPVGLYERIVTTGLRKAIGAIRNQVDLGELSEDEAPHALARLLHDRLVHALRAVPRDRRIDNQIELANRLLDVIATEVPDAGVLLGDHVATPGEILLAVRDDAGLGTGALPRPSLSLRQSDLLVNGPRDLRLGHELRCELPSADRVDVLVSFLKWSGVSALRPELARFLERRPRAMRVLTTTYLGASEPEAIEDLISLGAEVRVSYDHRRTRLHAKAWLFHRESEFSTAFVGSSNLSAAALLDGCEWNVRLSTIDNPAILSKLAVTFQQYWDDPGFEPYDRARFLEVSTRRDEQRDALARAVRLRAYPHQEAVLEALAVERARGHWKNLVVAATGTGKTVVAALDYARYRAEGRPARLLFVAHREEILQQSLATFRAALQDGHFGELLVGRHRPVMADAVFASIQSLHADRIRELAPERYDVVVVDEFHHAEADSYRRLLEHVRPQLLLGLTATPERADGRSILGWFDGRVAAEIRLWDALDQGLLSPFQYFGVHDGTDLSMIDWRAGRYDVDALDRVFTADDVRARAVLRAVAAHVRVPQKMRALGFCVSVRHATFMAEFFNRSEIPARVVHGGTPDAERAAALRDLSQGTVSVLFSVDLFNEGVDLPTVDTVLFLRPTESATVFLQQLGRGLRQADGKACLTVLDFIGNAHRRFRFDQRFRALLGGGSRKAIGDAIAEGFPFLPAGCDIRLDRESQEAVLTNLRLGLDGSFRSLVEESRNVGAVGLRRFVDETGVELEDLFSTQGRTYTAVLHAAGHRQGNAPDNAIARSIARLLYVDDPGRLGQWSAWLSQPAPPKIDLEDPLQWMLFVAMGQVQRPIAELGAALTELWRLDDLRAELIDLLGLLDDRRRRATWPLAGLPFQVHATYARDEVAAGLREERQGKLLRTQGGVYRAEGARADVLYVTLNKDPKHFTPTTLFNDYPVSPTRFHWESQSKTSAESETGRRYREGGTDGWRTLLFVRQSKFDSRGMTSPYLFLGPARYVSHEGERPMRIIWELERAMPAGFFAEVKIAAG